MTKDFIPGREADFVTWSATFLSYLLADPTTFGITAAQATAYQGFHNSFVTLFNTCRNDGTRTPAAIIAKDQAKELLKSEARMLAGIIQKFPGTTDEMRSQLGLTVPDREPSNVNPPTLSPGLAVESVKNYTVTLKITNPQTGKRSRPDGCFGVNVFSCVADSAPTNIDDWKWEGGTGKSVVQIVFNSSLPAGQKVFLTAQYFNYRKETGPAADPISTHLQGGGVSGMAA